jgi:hypothetical protein
MTEQELRTLVRDAIARHAAKPVEAMPPRAMSPHQHTSHTLIAVPAGADDDGLCIIEPAVSCNHCGYCKSLGH